LICYLLAALGLAVVDILARLPVAVVAVLAAECLIRQYFWRLVATQSRLALVVLARLTG